VPIISADPNAKAALNVQVVKANPNVDNVAAHIPSPIHP
jgi:hypothetical protein